MEALKKEGSSKKIVPIVVPFEKVKNIYIYKTIV